MKGVITAAILLLYASQTYSQNSGSGSLGEALEPCGGEFEMLYGGGAQATTAPSIAITVSTGTCLHRWKLRQLRGSVQRMPQRVQQRQKWRSLLHQ